MARAKISSVRGVSGAVSVQVLGVQETVARLAKVNAIANLEIGFMMRVASEEIAKIAEELAPERTGNLKTSIEASQVGPFSHIVVADTTLGSDPGDEGKNSYEYAGYVEFGTSKQSGQPFMRPAVEAVIPMVQAELNRLASRITSL